MRLRRPRAGSPATAGSCTRARSATQEEAAEVKGRTFDAHVSTNRTCEIGMERATGRPYVHVVQLLEQLTRQLI